MTVDRSASALAARLAKR